MKNTLIIAIALLMSISAIAQENKDDNYNNGDIQTIFGEIKHHGGYLGFTMKYGILDGLSHTDIGGNLVWILNHSTGIGLGGYGFFQEAKYDDQLNGNYVLQGGYGGLFIEPILFPKFPVHLSFPILIGAGGVAYIDEERRWEDSEWENGENKRAEDSEGFFVVEPGAQIELNVFKFLRVGVGGHYRYTSELGIMNRPNDALNGFTGSFSIKFGLF